MVSGTRPHRAVIALVVFCVAVGLGAANLALAGPLRNAANLAGPDRVPLTTGPAPECGAINSNATLNDTYAGMYANLPNVSGSWSPSSNTTPPVNQSGYPSVPVGEEQLIGAWLSICHSPAYVSDFASLGSSSLTSGLRLNGTTGYYQATYGFEWSSSCPSGSQSFPCQRSITWYVNLATGAVDGPLTSEWSPPPLGPSPVVSAPAPSTPGHSVFGLSPAVVDVLVAVGLLAGAIGVTAAVRAWRPGRSSSSRPSATEPHDLGENAPERSTRAGDGSTEPEGSSDADVRDDPPSDPLGDVY